MNKINIIKLVPKRACGCLAGTFKYCKYKAPHPPPIPSDWLSEDWDGEEAKEKVQRLLIDFDSPRTNPKQMRDPEILNELPIQNLSIQEDREEQEKLPEMTDTLVLPP